LEVRKHKMRGFLYFIVQARDLYKPDDIFIYMKIGKTSNPARRLSNYDVHYIGVDPPVYYLLWEVEDCNVEENLALAWFMRNRVKKPGRVGLSEVILTTKESVIRYRPSCPSAVLMDPDNPPRPEARYDAKAPISPDSIPRGRSRSRPSRGDDPATQDARGPGTTASVPVRPEERSSIPTVRLDEHLDLDPNMVPHVVPNKGGQIEITWSKLHLTYLNHFPGGLCKAILSLSLALADKGYVISDLSAVEGRGPCPIVGHAQPHTHIAIRIHNPGSGNFRLRSLKVLAIDGIVPNGLHVRLIKGSGLWERILSVWHQRESAPLQRIGWGPLFWNIERHLPASQDGLGKGWSVYIRIAEIPGNDAQIEIARQEKACFTYADKWRLEPNVRARCFIDRCSVDIPPSDRPNLQSLILSGASGILCYDRNTMAPRNVSITPWLEKIGMGYRTVLE
jgi:hypothetical protein